MPEQVKGFPTGSYAAGQPLHPSAEVREQVRKEIIRILAQSGISVRDATFELDLVKDELLDSPLAEGLHGSD